MRWIDPTEFIVDRVDHDDGVTEYVVDAARVYGAYLKRMRSPTSVMPVDEREQTYFKRIRQVDPAILDLADSLQPSTNIVSASARDTILETIRHWYAYTLYRDMGGNFLKLRLANIDGAADRYKLWIL